MHKLILFLSLVTFVVGFHPFSTDLHNNHVSLFEKLRAHPLAGKINLADWHVTANEDKPTPVKTGLSSDEEKPTPAKLNSDEIPTPVQANSDEEKPTPVETPVPYRRRRSTEETPTPATVGGAAAVAGQFPSTFTIRNPFVDTGRCGSVLLNQNHLLTAAHCCSNGTHLINPFFLDATGGDLNINQLSFSAVRVNVTHIFIHNQYNPNTRANDLCVLRLGQTINLPHPTVEAAERETRILPVATACQLAAWGSPTATGAINNLLNFVQQPILNSNDCNAQTVHAGAVLPEMICAGTVAAGQGPCGGAIGSPLFCNRRLVGILTNIGNRCGQVNHPAVYINTRLYENWINTQIARTDNPFPGTPIIQS